MKERFEPMIQPKPEEQGQEISPEQILEMSPQELVDYFTKLEKQNKLENFLESAAENDSLVAMFSYWEKWLIKDHRVLVDKMVEEKKKMYPENSESLPLNLEQKFTPEELELIFKNLGAIQLTFGCSKACPFCGVDAVPGARESIPYSQLANLFQQHGKELVKNKPLLYWASEPSDYASKEGLDDKTYQDVQQLAVEYANYEPFISSREITDDKWLKYLQSVNRANRISVYGFSDKKVEELKRRIEGKIQMGGEKESHTKGIGFSILEDKSQIGESGIVGTCCVLLTPRGLYNVFDVPISEKFPQGQIIMPIEKVSDQEIKKGDYLPDIMKRTVVSKVKDTSAYYMVWGGSNLNLIAVDKNYKIAGCHVVDNPTEEEVEFISQGGWIPNEIRQKFPGNKKMEAFSKSVLRLWANNDINKIESK